MSLRKGADKITQAAIQASLPDAAVAQALQTHHLQGNLYVIAVGKVAWQMADAAAKTIGSCIKHGVVITKYNHSKGVIGAMDIFEAGHPYRAKILCLRPRLQSRSPSRCRRLIL